MCNILAAVETGGQVYGKGRWDDFTEAGKNTANEKAITIGCYQFYGENAKLLLNKIRKSYPAKFKQLDTEGIAIDLDSKDWSKYKISKTSEKAKCIQKIIGSAVGIAAQKALMAEQITVYIDRAVAEGVTSVKSAMFCANIQHLGGKSAVQRIIKSCGKPLTIERLFATLSKDQKDTSNNNQVGDKLYWSRHVKVYGWIQEKVEEDEEKVSENYASKVIRIAEAEVGYLEKRSNSQLDSKTGNAGSVNYTKYGRDMHNLYPSVMDFPAAWCDAFVDWCFYKAYGVSNAKGLLGGKFDDYTPNSAQLYKNKGAWYKSPKVGDQIFFTNGSRICHTGLVYKVTSSKVYTIEGNTSGASGVIANGGGVCKKSYDLGYWKIAGYGRPKYDESSGTSNKSTNTTSGGNYMFEVKNLVKGDEGKEVELLQRLLVGHGYSVGKYGCDGSFGNDTKTAVEKFQKANEIKINYPGTVGSKTWKALIGL